MDRSPWDTVPEELGPIVADVLSSPAVAAVLEALRDAGPEAAVHLVRAGQELLLAAQVLVDAAGAVLEDATPATSSSSPPVPGGPVVVAPVVVAPVDNTPPSRVRRIDVA